MGKKGRDSHLEDWKEITGRYFDKVTNFRKKMSGWSLTADQITRANTAFVNAHSPETMLRVYTGQENKREKGVQVLLRYRDRYLCRDDSIMKNASGRMSWYQLKIPHDVKKRQDKLRLESYDSSLAKVVDRERDQYEAQHRNNWDKPATIATRSALLEVFVAEKNLGAPINDIGGYLADYLLVRPRTHLSRKATFNHILEVLDSPILANNKAVIFLIEALVQAVAQKAKKVGETIDMFLERIEMNVVDRWTQQLDKMATKGRELKQFRNCVAFRDLYIASNKSAKEKLGQYCLNNKVIQKQILYMLGARNSLIKEDIIEKDTFENKLVAISPNTVVRKSIERRRKTKGKVSITKSTDEEVEEEEDAPFKKRKRSNTSMEHKIMDVGIPQDWGIEKDKIDIYGQPNPEIDMPGTHKESCDTNISEAPLDMISPSKSPKNDFGDFDSPGVPSPIKVRKLELKEITPQIEIQQPNSPSPIKVKRGSVDQKKRPPWTKWERTKLLKFCLKYMEDPRRGNVSAGKKDIKVNVFPKVSPQWEEDPEHSRALDTIQEQYFRFGHPHKGQNLKGGMVGWLTEQLNKDQWTIIYIKDNRHKIAQDYEAQYTR